MTKVLTGYTSQQRLEFEFLKQSPVPAFVLLHSNEPYLPALRKLALHGPRETEVKLLEDIGNYMSEECVFLEDFYFVQFIPDDPNSYLNYVTAGVESIDETGFLMTNDLIISGVKAAFTKEEIEKINPDFMTFAKPVGEEYLNANLDLILNQPSIGEH